MRSVLFLFSVWLVLANQPSWAEESMEDLVRRDPCAVVRCTSETVCRVINGQAKCVRRGPLVLPISEAPPVKLPIPIINRRCPSACPLNYQPVCGSDGRTYGNSCSLRAAACRSSPGLTQVGEGPCQSQVGQQPQIEEPVKQPPVEASPPNNCQQMCLADYSPVCGSDGRTYSNECNMGVAACLQNKKIVVASRGECNSTGQLPQDRPQVQPLRCPGACPKILQPVCGSDGTTYNNECLLRQARCQNNDSSLVVQYRGRCSEVQDEDECECEED